MIRVLSICRCSARIVVAAATPLPPGRGRAGLALDSRARPPATPCYGNSYLVQWGSESSLQPLPAAPTKGYVFRVVGMTAAAGDSRKPMKGAQIARSPANKILQGDWNWHPNRGVVDPRVIWHNYKGKSLSVILYGDGHASAWREPSDLANQNFSPVPDPNYAIW